MPKDLVSVCYYCIWLCLQVQGLLCLLFIVRVPFFFSRVHISDFQNPSGLTKLFMIILILVLKFLFKFHPFVCVATELNEKLFLIYSIMLSN